jgi:hypothetical protein
MKIAVRLRRETGVDGRDLAFGEVFVDKLFDKVGSFNHDGVSLYKFV